MMSKDKSEDEYLKLVFLLLKCKQGQERKTLELKPALVNIKLAEVMWQTATTFHSDPSKSTYVPSILRLRDQIIAELENDSIHLKFIHDLVNSDKEQEEQLIDNNRNLINRAFFDLAQKVARKMLEHNDSHGKWLLHRSKDLIHRHIINVVFNEYIRNPQSNTLSIVSDHADILRFEYLEKWTEHLKVNLQSQRNTSLVEVLPTVKESIHIKLFSLEVELVSQSMSVYRPNQPFNETEQSLGLLAFGMWLNSLEQFVIPENNQENNAAINYAIKANETARAAALSFVKQKLSDPRLIKHINKKLPTFQPKEELVWAAQKVNHPQWQVSLTRAIVLLCRGLAYRYTDTIGIQRLDSVTPDGVRYEYTNGSKSEYLSSLRSLDVHKIASKMFEISTHSS